MLDAPNPCIFALTNKHYTLNYEYSQTIYFNAHILAAKSLLTICQEQRHIQVKQGILLDK